MDNSIWEKPNGMWTVASYVARAICTSGELAAAEQYFILQALGIENRFKQYWNHARFFERAGMAILAQDSLDQREDGRLAKVGDYMWARGNTTEALRMYEESIAVNDSSVLAGVAGIFRISFVLGDYARCIEAFERACPPHDFYEQYRLHLKTAHTDGMESFNRLREEFPGTSPYFLTQAKYMSRTVVAAAVRTGGVNPPLRSMIADYFELTPDQVDELAQAVTGEAEIPKLCKRLSPKPLGADGSFAKLVTEGDTANARRLAQLLPATENLCRLGLVELDNFLGSGDTTCLDGMVAACCCFGVAEADGIILRDVLDRRASEIIAKPYRRVVLLRRFGAKYDFLGEYLELLDATDLTIEPRDIISAILSLQWYKTSYQIDDTGPMGTQGGLGKTEISTNRDWLEIVLSDCADIFETSRFRDRDTAVATIYEAYQYLRQRFMALREEERWVSEAKLGDALRSLFGKEEVERHARPIWLSPQHLDYFLPRHRLAVEYMGVQHYEPVDIFGGNDALEATKKRDQRKRELCERMGIELIYVTHQQDIGERAREIHSLMGSRPTSAVE